MSVKQGTLRVADANAHHGKGRVDLLRQPILTAHFPRLPLSQPRFT
jgi:hypothetical protein